MDRVVADSSSEPSDGSDGLDPMAQHENDAVSDRRDGPQQTPRLRLKRKAPVSGVVDGAWWPHSDDLAAELPDLLTVLSVRLGTVARVTFNLDEWAPTPRRLSTDGGVIRLNGYHRQPADTIGVLDLRGNQLVLLVVPPATDPVRAHDILMAAAADGDNSSVASLLAAARATA